MHPAPESPPVDQLRVPPHNVQAEQSLLGGLMLDNQTWDRIADKVGERDFYRREHRLIFAALATLAAEDQPFDVVTVAEALDRTEGLADAGGLPYLGGLVADTPTAANIAAYARIVREQSVMRQLISAATDISDDAFSPQGRNSAELLDSAERRVFEIAEQQSRGGGGFQPIKALLGKAVERIDELFQRDEPITGLSSGFKDFDEMTSGLQPSDLVIVAGRPSMGKCVQADSEILLADGSVERIETLFQRKRAKLLSLGGDLKLTPAEPSVYVDDGIKPVFKVTTRLGRTIETTATHPFLTGSGWQRLAELKVGDRVGVPRVLPVFGDEAMQECRVKLLGYLLGDGCLTQGSPKLTNVNPAIQQDFMSAARDFGGLRVSLKRRNGRAPDLCIAADEVETVRHRQAFAERLRQALADAALSQRQLALAIGASPASVCGWTQGSKVPGRPWLEQICSLFGVAQTDWLPEGRESASKNAPNALTRWLSVLGIWGADAHAKIIPQPVFRLPREQLALFINRLFATDGWATRLASGQVQLGYSSVSERLMRQLQHLLLRFGVIAKLRARSTRCNGKESSAWQLDITDARSISTFISEIGIYGKEEAVGRVLAALESKRYQTNCDLVPMARSDLYWDQIVDISYQGEKQVYDLTIPKTHNFIANDICVHNTTFAMNMAEHAAITSKRPVAVYSMEMPGDSLAMRMMSSLGRIDQHRVRTGKLEDDEWPRLTSAVNILSQAQMFIDDTPAMTPTEVRARARRLKREHGDLGMIVLDYLQLMQAPDSGENRATEISAISRSLKSLAKELNVPVIALSQLNRSLEQRPNKRPVMSDLRESGAIEQDADLIVFIYRDEVYNEDSPEKGIAEIIIGKQRNGPIGTIKLAFLGKYTKFENYTPDPYSDQSEY